MGIGLGIVLIAVGAILRGHGSDEGALVAGVGLVALGFPVAVAGLARGLRGAPPQLREELLRYRKIVL